MVPNTTCAFWSSSTTSPDKNAGNVTQDVTYIPSHDDHLNSTSSKTTGYNDAPSDYYDSTQETSKVTTTKGRDNASFNAAYDAARRIRTDTMDPLNSKKYKTTIYTIGLGLTSAGTTLAEAVANDPISKYYNASQPTGMFVAASDKNALNAAFQKIASQILHLAQ